MRLGVALRRRTLARAREDLDLPDDRGIGAGDGGGGGQKNGGPQTFEWLNEPPTSTGASLFSSSSHWGWHGSEAAGHDLCTGDESVNAPLLANRRELETRPPMFVLRLPGVLLFRLAARAFLALLFQEPPR